MLKERFHDRKISKLEGFVWKTVQAWLGGKSCFPHTNAPNFGGRCNRYFWDIRLKILGLGNFNVPFQLVLTKLNCFRVYRKLIAWSSHEKSLLWLNKSWHDRTRKDKQLYISNDKWKIKKINTLFHAYLVLGDVGEKESAGKERPKRLTTQWITKLAHSY